MDVHAADTSHILTGGNDRCATVFNKDTEQVVAVLKGHTKKVTKALYHPEEVCYFVFFLTFKRNFILFYLLNQCL